MEKWINKTAIVTGASSGIGSAIVHDLAKNGINVIALARRLDRLEALKAELINANGKVIPMKCDVSEKSSIDAVFDVIEEKYGCAQIIVNNAGVAIAGSILGDENEIDDKMAQTIETNLMGLTRVTRRAYQLMEKSDDYGIIINIGSILGHSVPFGPFNLNVYSGTKHAVKAVTEVLRHELIERKNFKVRVCEICPGIVDTEIFDVGEWMGHNNHDSFTRKMGIAALSSADVSQTLLFMLMLPYSVNITELIVKPVGEKF